MRVDELAVYPIKSTAPVGLDHARVEPWGLADDRRWMIVDPDGTLITARRHPRLLHVRAQVLGPGCVRVEGPHAEALDVDTSGGGLVPVSVWSSTLDATRSPVTADAWFSALLERPVRLVWLDDPTRRAINPAHGRPGEVVSFADGYPLLLTTRTSLARLNDWITEVAASRDEDAPEPTAMNRFRPNVVVDGEGAFDEDRWLSIRIGSVQFRVTEPCARCVLTTIDPLTLSRGREPLRTLAKRRRQGTSVLFGANLIPDGVVPGDEAATIAVGDELAVLERDDRAA